MWTDKCEWMHGFTKFGDWHPNQMFRSKSVGKKKEILLYTTKNGVGDKLALKLSLLSDLYKIPFS